MSWTKLSNSKPAHIGQSRLGPIERGNQDGGKKYFLKCLRYLFFMLAKKMLISDE